MLIGYARVSTNDQDTAAQVAALEAAGCERIFREKASGGRWERLQFLRLLNQSPMARFQPLPVSLRVAGGFFPWGGGSLSSPKNALTSSSCSPNDWRPSW